jgi:putative membrane protein
MYMHYGTGPYGGVFGSFGGWFSLILFWLFIALLIAIFVKMFAGDKHGLRKELGNTPIDILKQRYAKGEINKKEFEEKKKDLSD